MNEKTLQQKQREFLLKNLKEQTSKNIAIDTTNTRCVYSPTKNSCGCFIGRHIKDKVDCQEMDKLPNSVSYYFEYLPWNLKELGKTFLLDVQSLYDSHYNWHNGLSFSGTMELDQIIKYFQLEPITLKDINNYESTTTNSI